MAKIAGVSQKRDLGLKKISKETVSRKETGGRALSAEERRARVERLAYQFFVERGYQHGYDAEDWSRAEAIILPK